MLVSTESQVVSIPSGTIDQEWGHVTNLRGLMSSLFIFSDMLSASTVKILHKKGQCYNNYYVQLWGFPVIGTGI